MDVLGAHINAQIEQALAARLGVSAPARVEYLVDDAIALYSAVKLPKHRKDGAGSTSSRLRAVSRKVGRVHALDLTHGRLDEYVSSRIADGVCESTAGQELRALSAAMRLSVKRGKILYNPLFGYDITAPQKDRDRCYLDEEIDRQLEFAIKCRAPEVFAVATIMRNTGIRPKELLRSKSPNLNWATGALFIPGDVAKTKKPRWCVIRQDGLEALRAIAKPGNHWLVPGRRTRHGRLANAAPLSQSTLNKQWRTVSEASGLALGPDGELPELYDLRGTLATRLGLVEGYEITQLMAAMGWTNPKQAEKYVRTGERQMLEQAARLEASERERKEKEKRPLATITPITMGRKKKKSGSKVDDMETEPETES